MTREQHEGLAIEIYWAAYDSGPPFFCHHATGNPKNPVITTNPYTAWKMASEVQREFCRRQATKAWAFCEMAIKGS